MPSHSGVAQLYGDHCGQPWLVQPQPNLADPSVRPFSGLWHPLDSQYGALPQRLELSAQLNQLALSGGVGPSGPVGQASLPAQNLGPGPYAPGPSRRQPVEYNHNKVITKKLANAVHYQQVRSVAP